MVDGSVSARSHLRDMIETIIIPQFCHENINVLFMDNNVQLDIARAAKTRLQEVQMSHI